MSQVAGLIFADPVRPEEIREFNGSLGGERSRNPDQPNDSVFARDGGLVLVHTYPVGDLPYSVDQFAAYTAALGAPPKSRVLLDVSRAPESEWLAAEITLAAGEKWHLIIDDFGEQVVTMPEFSARLGKRAGNLFLPEGRFDPSPAAMRKSRVTLAALLLPGRVRKEECMAVLRSLGARLSPDEHTDAVLERAGAQVWVHLHGPGDHAADLIKVERKPLYCAVIAEPPYGCVELEISKGTEPQRLAAELVEAIAAHWPLIVHGTSKQLMSVDQVRVRVAAGATVIFDP